MTACSFCGEEMPRGEGIIYVKKDGTTFFLCSSKCKRNLLNLKREGRRQKWTEASRKFKEMSGAKKKK